MKKATTSLLSHNSRDAIRRRDLWTRSRSAFARLSNCVSKWRVRRNRHSSSSASRLHHSPVCAGSRVLRADALSQPSTGLAFLRFGEKEPPLPPSRGWAVHRGAGAFGRDNRPRIAAQNPSRLSNSRSRTFRDCCSHYYEPHFSQLPTVVARVGVAVAPNGAARVGQAGVARQNANKHLRAGARIGKLKRAPPCRRRSLMPRVYLREAAAASFCWAFFCLRGKRDLPLLASLGILIFLGAVAGLTTTPTSAATLGSLLLLATPHLRAGVGAAAIMRQRSDSSGLGRNWLAESADGGSSESGLSGWPERPVPTGYHRYSHCIHRQRRSSLSAQKSAHPAYFANSSTTR